LARREEARGRELTPWRGTGIWWFLRSRLARRTAHVTQADEQRIAREEQYWTTPRLLILGFSFLGICLVAIYAIATLAFAAAEG
jgi:hypothetical protein